MEDRIIDKAKLNINWVALDQLILFYLVVHCNFFSSMFRKEEPIYMFDQGPYPTTAITGHTKYREYSNPGFILSSNMSRE
jgi:hypothetical protein